MINNEPIPTPETNIQNLVSSFEQTAVIPKCRKFSSTEVIFAWLSLLFGYLFCRSFPIVTNPFGSFLWILSIFITTTVIFILKKVKFSKAPVAVAVSGIGVAFSLFISANEFVHFLAFAYAGICYCYFVYAVLGNRLEGGFSSLILLDFFRALFVMPFSSIDALFTAFSSTKNNKTGRTILKVLAGIAIAVIPTAIILALLSYDKGFISILSSIFSFNIVDIFLHLISFGLGMPVGMFIFSLYVSSADHHTRSMMNADMCRNTAKKMQKAPIITVFAAAVPILFIYIVFFISQWKYYISGFVGELPDGTSYADYARDGFFQLCAVSVINLIIIICLNLFAKRKENKKAIMPRLLTTVFSVFTLVLISTAMAKMILYIDYYGLTPKRVYSSWFMMVLAIIFLFTLLKQIFIKIKLIPTAVTVTVVMFFILGICGTDSIIAKYNVDRYLSGSLQTVDLSALDDLGDSAVPQLVRLSREVKKSIEDHNGDEHSLSQKKQLYNRVNTRLEKLADNRDTSVFSITLPRILADNALKEDGYVK